MNGQAVFDGLAPGTYSARPLAAAVLPGTIVTPAQRTAIVTNDSAATLAFSFSLERSLSLFCRLPGTPPGGFACLYEVRNSGGSLIDSGALSAANPATTLWNLNPATLEVRLIPDPAVPGQASWPTHSQIVVLDSNTQANVYYPFNPANLQTVSGYAYHDSCAPLGTRANTEYCNETGAPSSNNLTVKLFDSAEAVIATTQTGPGSGLNSGYFAFPNLPIGSYRVAVDLPTGFSPTTATEYGMVLDGIASVEQVFFGYQLDQNRALYGRVYTDMNSNGQFDLDWDDPLPGIAVTISTPAGQVVATRNTASDGSFTVDPINSGEYRVSIAHNGETLTQVASVPASGAIPNVDFALPPADNLPSVIVFVDADRDGVVDPDEQRLSGISVSLADKPCSQIGSVLETKVTLSDGTVIFAAPPAALLAPQAAPPPGGGYLCAAITAGLASNFMPAANSGVNVPRTTNNVTPLPVQTVGVLLAGFFWDANGNMLQDDGEPSIGGGSVTVNGINRTIPFNGSSPASFLLLPGTYSLQVTAPFNYEPATSMPMAIVLNPNASQTISIPFRAASGISGLISGASASLVGGLTVELEKVSGGQVWHTTSSTFVGDPTTAGLFAFDNLPAGEYRLRLPQPPPGYAATSEPLINLAANMNHTENMALAPTGHVAGQVFLDVNGDGQRQSGETGSNAFYVQLISLGAQVLQNVTPASDGTFILEGLNANTPYTIRVVLPNSSWFMTASPGVFTVGAADGRRAAWGRGSHGFIKHDQCIGRSWNCILFAGWGENWGGPCPARGL